MALLDLLGRRWALRVVWELREDAAPTFRELQQRAGGISSSVLTARLRELTEAGIVRHGEDGGNGGYTLTPRGHDLLRCLLPLERWAAAWTREAS